MQKFVILTLACSSLAWAQQFDIQEFGAASAGAIRSAIWIDYFNKKCRAEKDRRYFNLTDSVLKETGGGRSALFVLKNAAKMSGITVEKIVRLCEVEVDEQLASLGGCKSKKMLTWVDEAKMTHYNFNAYLVDVAAEARRNPDKQIFR